MHLITDGRFSGGTHGFSIGHIGPEAAVGGPIGLIKNGDLIEIDADKGLLKVHLTNKELIKERRNGNQKKQNTLQEHYGSILNLLVRHLKELLHIQVRLKRKNVTQIYNK